MYIPKQKLAQLAKDVQAEIRIFYEDPKNREKFKDWQKKRNNIIKQSEWTLKVSTNTLYIKNEIQFKTKLCTLIIEFKRL